MNQIIEKNARANAAHLDNVFKRYRGENNRRVLHNTFIPAAKVITMHAFMVKT
jgi:hypothetical protein